MKNHKFQHSINASTSDYANECQWYDVLLELHIKSSVSIKSRVVLIQEKNQPPPNLPSPAHYHCGCLVPQNIKSSFNKLNVKNVMHVPNEICMVVHAVH